MMAQSIKRDFLILMRLREASFNSPLLNKLRGAVYLNVDEAFYYLCAFVSLCFNHFF
jgi:hypothetical protein